MTEIKAGVRLTLDDRAYGAGLRSAGQAGDRFIADTRKGFNGINTLIRDARTQLAGLGLGFGAVATLRESAQLDQSLTRIRQGAGATRGQAAGLRKELFQMARETGNSVDALTEGASTLIASGQSWESSLEILRAINPAMAVTGAQAGTLAEALSVAAETFQFDLSQPGMALKLLDQMTVAGRAGKAELQNLAPIFGRIGGNAARAGMSFEQTLGFIEQLSLTTPIGQLDTLGDSTLRLFTNLQYLRNAEKASGVAFFDKAGARRDPVQVLTDLTERYRKLRTANQKEKFLGSVFKGADQDTIRGLTALMSGGSLERMRKITALMPKAFGTIKGDMADTMDNAVVQAARVKAIFAEAGDSLAAPLNKFFADSADVLTRPKSQGGMEMDSAGMLIGGGGALAVGAGLWHLAKRGAGAAGRAAMSGATAAARKSPLLARAGYPMLALAGAGYGGMAFGDWVWDKSGGTPGGIAFSNAFGRGVDYPLSYFSDAAQRRRALTQQQVARPPRPGTNSVLRNDVSVGGVLKIEIDARGVPRVTQLRADGPMNIEAGTGPLMLQVPP